jgi:hypothetical protein
MQRNLAPLAVPLESLPPEMTICPAALVANACHTASTDGFDVVGWNFRVVSSYDSAPEDTAITGGVEIAPPARRASARSGSPRPEISTALRLWCPEQLSSRLSRLTR